MVCIKAKQKNVSGCFHTHGHKLTVSSKFLGCGTGGPDPPSAACRPGCTTELSVGETGAVVWLGRAGDGHGPCGSCPPPLQPACHRAHAGQPAASEVITLFICLIGAVPSESLLQAEWKL